MTCNFETCNFETWNFETWNFDHRGDGAHFVRSRSASFLAEALALSVFGFTRMIFATADACARRESRSIIAEVATPGHWFVDVPRARFEARSPATSADVA